MTTRYTDDEWATIIAETERNVRVSDQPYACPPVGSPEFARTIDHTLLKLEATSRQIDDLCAEARVAEFATVCVRPNYVSQAVIDLKGSPVQVASVIGFHEGTHDLYEKLSQTALALSSGAHELDIVLNRPVLQSRAYSQVFHELSVLRAQAPPPTRLKLILETSQLSAADVVAACTLAAAAGFDFVKTSTGFLGHGATAAHVRLMRACCDALALRPRRRLRDDDAPPAMMKVKASGGIRTLQDAVEMLEAGAERLGTSGGVWIVKEGREMSQTGGVVAGLSGEGRRGSRPGLATRLFTDY
ncbi:hypothetical protein MBLNU459_g2443t1 [Dothideomycetes sp. NU459]